MKADMLSVVYAYGAFILAYSANILFSLYLNISMLKQAYNRKKAVNSIKKAIVLVVATLMLVLAIDVVVMYFSAYVPELKDLGDVTTVTMVIVTIGRAALSYILEAYDTFTRIIEVKEK